MIMEAEHRTLRERIVAILNSVLPSGDSHESLNLLLGSLEACLKNDRAVFIVTNAPSSVDIEHCRNFTVWVIWQLCVVFAHTTDDKTLGRVRAFIVSLLRTLQSRDPSLLNGPVLSVWMTSLQQLTVEGCRQVEPPVLFELPTRAVVSSSGGVLESVLLNLCVCGKFPPVWWGMEEFSSGKLKPLLPEQRWLMIQLLLCDSVLAVFMPSNAQLSRIIHCLTNIRPPSQYYSLIERALNQLMTPWCSSAQLKRSCSKLSFSLAQPSQLMTSDQLIDELFISGWTRAAELTADKAAVIEKMSCEQRIGAVNQLLDRLLADLVETSIISHTSDIYTACISVLSLVCPATLTDQLDDEQLTSAQMRVAAVTSLPWLLRSHGDLPVWRDLHVTQPDQRHLSTIVTRLHEECAEFAATVDIGLCLATLIRLPRCICPQWRWGIIEQHLVDVSASITPGISPSDRAPSLLLWCCVSLSPNFSDARTITQCCQMIAESCSPADSNNGEIVTASSSLQLEPASFHHLICLASHNAVCLRERNNLNSALIVCCSVCHERVATPSGEKLNYQVEFSTTDDIIESVVKMALVKRTWRPLIGCLNHTKDAVGVVKWLLRSEPVADWSNVFRAVIAAGSDWSDCQEVIFDWLNNVDSNPQRPVESAYFLLRILTPPKFSSLSARLRSCQSEQQGRTVTDAVMSTGLLELLVTQLTCSHCAVTSGVAHLIVLMLAQRANCTPASLFQLNKTALYRTIAKQIVERQIPLLQLSNLAAAWEFRDLASLMRLGLRHLVPMFVTHLATHDNTRDYISDLAALLETRRRDLLIDNYASVLCHVVRSGRRASLLSRVHTLVSSSIGVCIDEVRRCSVQNQINELLECLHAHPDDVVQEWTYLASLDQQPSTNAHDVTSMTSHSSDFSSTAETHQLASYLSPRVLGVLGWVDQQVASRSVSDWHKQQLLLSLGQLCQLLGPVYLSPVSRKMMASIRSGVDCLLSSSVSSREVTSEVTSEVTREVTSEVTREVTSSETGVCVAKVWRSFLMALSNSSVRGVTAEILVHVASTLSLAHCQPVVHCLLTERRQHLSEIWHELPELPVVWHHQLSVDVQLTAEASVSVRLARAARCLQHDSQLVQQHALRCTSHLLTNSQLQVMVMCEDRDTCSSHVLPLLHSLLQCGKHADSHCQLLLSTCLGSIGALDPARLAISPAPPPQVSTGNPAPASGNPTCDVDSVQFVVSLLTELCRVYTAADSPVTQACAAFSMQEVLKAYNMNDTAGTGTGTGAGTGTGTCAWSQVPSELQQILAPMCRSQYQLSSSARVSLSPARHPPATAQDATWSQAVCHVAPVYTTANCLTHYQWLGMWLSRLISYVKRRQMSLVLTATRPLLARAPSLAVFLLPHVLVCALIDSSSSSSSSSLATADKSDVTESVSDVILREISAVLSAAVHQQQRGVSVMLSQCCRSVWCILDAVFDWRRRQLSCCGFNHRQLTALIRDNPAFTTINQFLKQVPYDLVAESARACAAYQRALQAIEMHLQNEPQQLPSKLPFLQDVYVSLREPDGVSGVAATRTSPPSLHDQLVLHRSRAHTQHCLPCYEQLCSFTDSETLGYQGLISCYLSLDQASTALGIARDLVSRADKWRHSVSHLLVESVWRLGRWEELGSALQSTPLPHQHWNTGVALILHHAERGRVQAVTDSVKMVRLSQISSVCSGALETDSYTRLYECIIRLHCLTDMETCLAKLLCVKPTTTTTTTATLNVNTTSDNSSFHQHLVDIIEGWKRRTQLLQQTTSSVEPVLTVQRAVLCLIRDRLRVLSVHDEDSTTLCESLLDAEISRSWLYSARLYRESGRVQNACNCLLRVSERQLRHLPVVFIEQARLLWQAGDGPAAILTLSRGVQRHFPDWQHRVKNNLLDQNARDILCDALLRLARYSEQSATTESAAIRQYFSEAAEVRRDSEHVHFHSAKYLDRLMQALPVSTQDPALAVRVMHALGKSLQFGCCHVYEAMPRLLSIWLDSGGGVSGVNVRSSWGHQSVTSGSQQLPGNSAKTVDLMNKLMSQLSERVPLYCFLTCLSQLVSRICHANAHIYAHIRLLLAKLLTVFPQQCVWHMLAVSRSSYPTRVQRCLAVFSEARAKQPSLTVFIDDATRLAEKLIDLSNKPVDAKTVKLSLSSFFPSLRRLICDNFSSIILPLQQQMLVNVPETSAQHGASFRPFPEQLVCIAGFDDQIEVMTSLVKPKKITLKGTDGRSYTMMAKPKDDLRKDCRLMEFNSLVNRQLSCSQQARIRSLRIRTYSVIPLNEECGLLEWVPYLSGMRHILITLYRQNMGANSGGGNVMSLAEVKSCFPAKEAVLADKRAVFVDVLLARHPPLLSRWFLANFDDPQNWYKARVNYARTAAVMSMTGYILGLGDRHGENILLDSASGDCVHVDFNCLFNKGESLDWPERVPFRLTHNMVDALGPTGVEGIFRTACEVTMSVIREQRETLMCVLRPFVHDPLVEWTKQDRRTRDIGEIVNEKAQAHVGDIEQRVRGQVRSLLKPVPIPLSVSGQVNYLIDEATSVDNLCQMYIGWAPYL